MSGSTHGAKPLTPVGSTTAGAAHTTGAFSPPSTPLTALMVALICGRDSETFSAVVAPEVTVVNTVVPT